MLNFGKKIEHKHALYMQVLFSALAFFLMVIIFYVFMSNNARGNLVRNTKSLMDYMQYEIQAILLESQMVLDSNSQTIRKMILRGVIGDLPEFIRSISGYLSHENKFHR